ncbi:MAG: 50S ribosomal protein L24 [Rhodospirillaceae bacterium]|mgnify:FL=1|jgi:large subunit ribosomal protein L24|nr:50S ribosomal protein L24 [Rhodospirillaceae bacterium]
MAARIRKGDEVIVLSGRDKGKKGSVLKVLTDEDRVIVQGVHIVKRHQRQSQTEQGGIVEKEASIHVSNVSLLDPESGDATKVGFRLLEDGRKVRFAKRSGEVID